MMDVVFKNQNLTDFEQLLYALDYIKLLKKDVSERDIRIGQLQSEIDELKHKIDDLMLHSKEVRKEIKKELVYKEMNGTICELQIKNSKLKKDLSDLLIKYLKVTQNI